VIAGIFAKKENEATKKPATVVATTRLLLEIDRFVFLISEN